MIRRFLLLALCFLPLAAAAQTGRLATELDDAASAAREIAALADELLRLRLGGSAP